MRSERKLAFESLEYRLLLTADLSLNNLQLVTAEGFDTGTPVAEGYEMPFRFTGRLSSVTITLD